MIKTTVIAGTKRPGLPKKSGRKIFRMKLETRVNEAMYGLK